MDPETGCGITSTGKKARLLIGTACWFQNIIGWILAAALRPLAWVKHTHPYNRSCLIKDI